MSTQQVRIQSGLYTTPLTLSGSAQQVFFRNNKQSGDVDAGDNSSAASPAPGSSRWIKNKGANVMYVGKDNTVAAGTGYPLDPGESIVIAGPSGAGYTGDLWVIGTAADVLGRMAF